MNNRENVLLHKGSNRNLLFICVYADYDEYLIKNKFSNVHLCHFTVKPMVNDKCKVKGRNLHNNM